jgi:AcrR family transcriptional regulator
MKLRTGSKPELVVQSELPKVIKLTMGNLVLPRVTILFQQDFYITRNPDVTFMPRIIQEYREEVGKKIVEAAYHHFLQKGYHGTTMSEIAKSLGVTKPALYQYFPGKEDLYAAVAEHGREELAAILEQSFTKRDLRTGSEVLFDTLAQYAPRFNTIYSEMVMLAMHNERIGSLLRQDRIEDINIVESFIARRQESGLVSGQLNPRVLAIACDALINGLLMDIMAGMDKEEAKKIWIAAVTQLTRTD